MAGKRVLVIGGNFGGFTAALELEAELGADVEVTVVSAADRFLFNPSLIWLPFGKRRAADITFALEPVFDTHGIGFVDAEVTAIDPVARTVTTAGGSYGYDYLVVATGYRNKFDIVLGLGPDGHAQTITTLADAERAGVAWRKFLDDPGPVVIAATQGASCFGAAYEFLFNASHQLRKAKLHNKGAADLRHFRAVRRALRHRRPARRGEVAEHVPEEGGHHCDHRGRVRGSHR